MSRQLRDRAMIQNQSPANRSNEMNAIYRWHALRRSARIALGLLAFASGGTFADETTTPTNAAQPEQLGPIVVEAPEPKFVAPTSRDRIGRIWAPVLIDGKGPYRLVLDTGANHSAVTEHTAQALGVAPALETSAHVTGFTGSAVVSTIQVNSMEIGDLALGSMKLPVLADVFGGADGVLSLNGLTHERIYADFAHDRLEIMRSQRQSAPLGYAVVPLRMTGGLPVARVRIGGIVTDAIIDTGAQLSVGNLALRDALARKAPINALREDIVGVTLDTQSGDRIPAPDMQIGHLTIRGVNIVFGDMYLFQHWKLTRTPTLAIGMDLLGSFDVLIIDYAQREMQLRPRVAPK
jgi:predicted aspartyl protease